MYLVPNKMSGNSITHFAERDNEKPRGAVHSSGRDSKEFYGFRAMQLFRNRRGLSIDHLNGNFKCIAQVSLTIDFAGSNCDLINALDRDFLIAALSSNKVDSTICINALHFSCFAIGISQDIRNIDAILGRCFDLCIFRAVWAAPNRFTCLNPFYQYPPRMSTGISTKFGTPF